MNKLCFAFVFCLSSVVPYSFGSPEEITIKPSSLVVTAPKILTKNSLTTNNKVIQDLFKQFLPTLKVSGKTYAPSVIAIIGDKPYISLEVFHKFSPFSWIMRAFQGKVQDICGSLSSSAESGEIMDNNNPQNILSQLIIPGNGQNIPNNFPKI